MEDKDFVAMTICPICKEPTGVAIHKQLRKTLPKTICNTFELCEKCLKDAKENDWFIIYEANPNEHSRKHEPIPTGRYLKCNFNAINKEQIDEDLYKFIDKNRFTFATTEEFNHIAERGKEE